MPNISTLADLIRQGKPFQSSRSGCPEWISRSSLDWPFLCGIPIDSFKENPEFSRIFQHFPGEGFWGSGIALLNFEMLGSAEKFTSQSPAVHWMALTTSPTCLAIPAAIYRTAQGPGRKTAPTSQKTNVCRVKNAMKLGILWLQSVWWKMAWNLSWKMLGTFELRFLRKEERQNFTRNLTAFSMVTSTRGFRRIFHGSTSASLAEIQKSLRVHQILVRKIWFTPPPKGAQNEKKLYKSVANPQNWHFFRGGGWARETGAICQIGVLTQKRCIFWAQKRLFGWPCLCPNATKQSTLAKIHFFTRSQNLEGKSAIFTVLKWGKGRNHHENHDLGHNHWKRSAKRPKTNPFWTQNVHGFQVKTPIWQMAPISRIYGGGTQFYGQNDFMDIWVFLRDDKESFWASSSECPKECSVECFLGHSWAPECQTCLGLFGALFGARWARLVARRTCYKPQKGQNLDIFENPYGPPRPTESQPPPPQQQKKRNSQNPENPIIPKSKRSFPKSKRSFPKSKLSFPKVNVKYFLGIFDVQRKSRFFLPTFDPLSGCPENLLLTSFSRILIFWGFWGL